MLLGALLLEFVVSRIEDREVGIGSGAKALLALEERGKWTPETASRVLMSYVHPRVQLSHELMFTRLFDNTHPLINSGSQAQRYPVLLLIDLLMAKYRSAISELNDKDPGFLSKFVSYFDGEKDPRNLMIVFSILAVVTTEWDISSCVQEVFDASFNYFPITFRPPPDDTYKITAQDLKDRLRKCISANSALAPYAYPALLDKLDSTSINTKRDVLQTILDTTVHYGPRTVALYSITLWDAIKFEILQNQEEDLAVQSLEVLAGISASLSHGSREGLLQYLQPVVKECNEHFEDAPTKQSDAAIRILSSIAASSAEAYNVIVSGVLPHLFSLYQSTKDVPKKRSLVEVLSKLVAASSEVYGDWLTTPMQSKSSNGTMSIVYGRAAENAMKQFSAQAFDLLTSALAGAPIKSVSYRLTLLDAALQLSKAREILKDEEISSLIRILNDIILVEESVGKDEAKVVATNALAEIAQQKPQLVIDHSFPAFLSKLPDNDIGYSEKYLPVLEAFAKLGIEGKIFNTVVLRLKNKLNAAVYQKASAQYIQALLSALLYTFSHTTSSLQGTDDACPFYADIVQPLLATTIPTLGAERQDDLTFSLIGRLCNEILRHQSTGFQKGIAVQIYTISLPKESVQVAPFNVQAAPEECQHLIISAYLLAALRRDIVLEYDIASLITALFQISTRTDISPGTKAASLQHISLFINKFLPNKELRLKLTPIIDQILGAPASADSIRSAFCVLKALLLRNAPLVNDIFPPLIKVLSDPEAGLATAYGFSALLQPDPILTKENHCVVSPLHKHKTFAILAPEIATGFKAADVKVKKNYLIALSGTMRWLPYAVLEPEISSLTPLLLQTLDIQGEDDIKAGTINEFTDILIENGAAVEEHIGSLITRLLALSGLGNAANLRAKALQCLALVAVQLRIEIVVPYRKSVVQKLTAALDDKKRAVRAEAVKCRRKWIELDTAGDDDEE
jgi:DNA repair/transcription protein MET18/MMS19